MSEAFPPLYNFDGINFNSDYFAIPNTSTGGGGGISIDYANSHYLASYAGAVATSLASSTSFSNKIINTNTLYALPTTGTNGGNGDRLIIYQGGTGIYPYSIGASSGSMWYSVPSLKNHNFLVNGTSVMNIGAVGVGIGTTNPTAVYTLDVNGSIYSRGTIVLSAGANIDLTAGNLSGILFPNNTAIGVAVTGGQYSGSAGGGDMVIRSGTGKNLYLTCNGGAGYAQIGILTASNNVGIGTNIVSNAGLGVYATSGTAGDRSLVKCGPYGSDYLVMGCADTVGNAGGNANTAVIINSGASLRIESATGKNILMNFLNTGGFVAIGGVVPTTRLHVAPGSFGYGLQTQTWFQQNSSGLTTNYRDVANLCATFESSISVNGIITATSDERIKKNIEVINNGIEIIKQLEPKKYNYIDGLTYGANLNYGFIAQDVEKILPDLIIKNKNVIPNIYKKASCFDNQITTDFNISSILNIGDDVEIITGEKRKFYKIIDIVDEFNFIINEELKQEEVFIYGSKIDDILSISKDDIFSINVKATKELITKVEELSKIVETQQEQINKLLSLIK